MWLWKAEEEYQRVPAILEKYLTPQEMARLTDLRQRLHTISEFVCRDEERRLRFVRWLVQQGRLQGDT